MIIDEILDRRAGCKYDPEYLVDIAETDGFDNVVKAFKSKDENAVKTALKEYVNENGYDNKPLFAKDHPLLKYIDSQQWIIQ